MQNNSLLLCVMFKKSAKLKNVDCPIKHGDSDGHGEKNKRKIKVEQRERERMRVSKMKHHDLSIWLRLSDAWYTLQKSKNVQPARKSYILYPEHFFYLSD